MRRRFEFAVVVIVVSAFVLPLIAALVRYQGIAERQQVETEVRDMQTFLRLKMLDLMVTGRHKEIRQLAGSNPIALLERQPAGYAGEAEGTPPSTAASVSFGVWYFDRQHKRLVYVPGSFAFPYQPGESKALRWELQNVQGSEMSVRLVPLV